MTLGEAREPSPSRAIYPETGSLSEAAIKLKNQGNNVINTESDLMKKLNYVVHMLEEQHDEKTQSITEELILYTFLGIFVNT